MEYPIEYVPDTEFADYCRAQKEREIIVIDGSNRWLITKEDGTKVIIRPESTK